MIIEEDDPTKQSALVFAPVQYPCVPSPDLINFHSKINSLTLMLDVGTDKFQLKLHSQRGDDIDEN